MRAVVAVACLVLSGCSDLAWNTTVADSPGARLAMLDSVVIGETTDTDFVTRWGLPTQKVHRGGQVEYIYRNMANPPGYVFPQFGTSERYAIVTFQYGLLVDIRTSDQIRCRATFPPRPPGYDWPNPSTVRPVGACGGAAAPGGTGGRQPVTDDRYIPGGPGKL